MKFADFPNESSLLTLGGLRDGLMDCWMDGRSSFKKPETTEPAGKANHLFLLRRESPQSRIQNEQKCHD